MNLENAKAGDKIRISNGTAEPVQELEVERVTKTQVVCLDKNGKKQSGIFATKFNKVTGRQVGDWMVPYFAVSVVAAADQAPVEDQVQIVGRQELFQLQAPAFNFELNEKQLLEKALETGFVSKVPGCANSYRINNNYGGVK